MTRSPWHHEPRKRLTEQDKTKLFLERNGCCRECGHKFRPGDKREWIIEHILALENGGTNDWENLGITCTLCKPAKDAEDHAQAAKSRSKAVRHFLPKSQRQKKPWPKRTFNRERAE
jgi:5-methylcytosine-specific restriction enzyme A